MYFHKYLLLIFFKSVPEHSLTFLFIFINYENRNYNEYDMSELSILCPLVEKGRGISGSDLIPNPLLPRKQQTFIFH